MCLTRLELWIPSKADDDNGEKFFLFDKRDALAQEYGFDFRVLVPVSDFADGAEPDRESGMTV